MKRALRIEPAGRWPRDRARGSVTLDHDDRHRRRLRLATDAGEDFLLDLPRAVAMGDGDGLALDDGSWIEVHAKPELLLEVTAPPELLCRLAWHIGNRHIPAAIEPHRILLRDDHVVAGMLRHQGASLRHVSEPFTPEAGAYDGHEHHARRHDH
jgi:urease accessory protein